MAEETSKIGEMCLLLRPHPSQGELRRLTLTGMPEMGQTMRVRAQLFLLEDQQIC
jgi:hypothetical protein